MSTTPSYHLPHINTKATPTKDHASLPTTPKSSSSVVKFHYDPYNNFNRVYMSSTSTSPSATSTPRSIAAAGGSVAGGCKQEQYSYKNTSSSSHDNSSYDDENDHAHETSSLSGDEDQHEQHVSGTCTPAVRMETEQQFNEAECGNNNNTNNDINDNNNNSEMMMMMTVPKPRSSNIQETEGDDEGDHALDRQHSNTLRASTRTMQHLLQNVPYLFLDTVAESTVMCRDTRHRVGQLIRTWSGPKTPLELEQEFPERYRGQCIRDIFVAQLPFDLPLDAVQLVADLLIDGPRIHVLHAAPHIKAHKSYDGCSFVKMFECDAVRFINAMHKRVLFDVDGVWVATTTAELQELTDYCAWFQEQKHDQRKEILKMPTPFSAMTAEFALRGSRRATGNFYDNRQPHQQQQSNQQQQSIQNNNTNNNTTYYHAAPPSADQHYYYNAVYDQNPHQRQVSSTNNNYINHYRHHHNNNNNGGGYQQQQQHYHHHQHQQQQGTYQQGCSFYPNQAQNQYLAPHQQRALQNSNYHNGY